MANPTVSVTKRKVPGDRYLVFAQITGSGSYPNTGTFATSGYPLTNVLLPLQLLSLIDYAIGLVGVGGYFGVVDPVTNNLHIFQCAAASNPATELTNAANDAAITVPVLVFGV